MARTSQPHGPKGFALVFSSSLFLFLFLPGTLGLYFAFRKELRNALLVAVSLLYYAWGEAQFMRIVLASVALNYLFGLLVARRERRARFYLGFAVVTNLGLLAHYKYADFFAATLDQLFGSTSTARASAI